MYDARKSCVNTESVALKQPRLSDVPAKAGQRDSADSDCGPGVMDCRSPDSALILPGVQPRSRCCPDQPSLDKVPSLEGFGEGEIKTQLARSENSANPYAVPNLRAEYNLNLHALCGRAQISVEIPSLPGSVLSENQQTGSLTTHMSVRKTNIVRSTCERNERRASQTKQLDVEWSRSTPRYYGREAP